MLHRYNQARATQLQVLIDKHIEDNKVLAITVSELHATVSALNDSLKEQRMEYDDSLTKQNMELVQEYEDKLTNTKVINIAIVNRHYVPMFALAIQRRLRKTYKQWQASDTSI